MKERKPNRPIGAVPDGEMIPLGGTKGRQQLKRKDMAPTSLIIVTDRGSLKAYKVDETPNRGAGLRLVQAFDTTDAHGRYEDKLTDQAGGFPDGNAGSGRNQNSIAERKGIET